MSARKPGFVVLARRTEACRSQRPVLVDERHDVCDRRQGDEVEVLDERVVAEQHLAEP